VHHKTRTNGGSTHYGFPDATYFNRVRQELALKGVVFESDDQKRADVEEVLTQVCSVIIGTA